jgi:hypothetical protein
MFSMLALAGTWAVPRSGLIFHKASINPPILKLLMTMPYDPDMPVDENELLEFQRADLEVIRDRFKLAGITVEGEVA